MNKIKTITLVIMLLLVVGCTNKDDKILSCEVLPSEVNGDVTSNLEIVYDYTGEEMKSFSVENNVYLGENASADDEQLLSDCSEYADIDGVKCSASLENGTYLYSISYDLTKVSEEFLKSDDFVIENYEDYKKSLTDMNYVCK